jgi:hypothetical protein
MGRAGAVDAEGAAYAIATVTAAAVDTQAVVAALPVVAVGGAALLVGHGLLNALDAHSHGQCSW